MVQGTADMEVATVAGADGRSLETSSIDEICSAKCRRVVIAG
jgi:hypothetical protein